MNRGIDVTCPSRTKRRIRLAAFTIVELLVVIAILVILISFLLPSINSARHILDTTQSARNIREVHTAAMAYTFDHGTLPSSWDWVRHNGYYPNSWNQYDAVKYGTLYSYLQDDATRICPVFKSVYKQFAGNENKEVVCSYMMNAYIGDRAWGGQPNIQTVHGISNPAEFLLFCEENAWIAAPYARFPINNGAMGVGSWNGGAIDAIGSFHDPPNGNLNEGSSNVAFLDGHVALHHISESKELATPLQFRP